MNLHHLGLPSTHCKGRLALCCTEVSEIQVVDFQLLTSISAEWLPAYLNHQLVNLDFIDFICM